MFLSVHNGYIGFLKRFIQSSQKIQRLITPISAKKTEEYYAPINPILFSRIDKNLPNILEILMSRFFFNLFKEQLQLPPS